MVAQPRAARTRMESSLPVLSRASSADESNGSADGRVRKLQRTSGTDNNTRRKSSVTSAPRPPPADSNNNNNNNTTTTRAGFRGRRQSVRDHKVPLGPRPYEKQRVTSDASVASQGRAFPVSFNTQAQPAAPADADADANANANANAGERLDFIPAVTFDDFANSLQYEPALSNFPAPPHSSSLASSHMAPQSQHQFTPSHMAPQPQHHFTSSATASSARHAPSPLTTSATDTRPARTTSLIRRFSQSRTKGAPPNAPTEQSSIPPPASTMSIRTRRQSQFPAQPPPNPAARAPPKSAGPGTLPTPSLDGRQQVPRLASDNVQTRMGRTSSFGQGNRRGTLPPNLNLGPDPIRVPSATRAAKAKSLHAPPRHQSIMLNAPTASDQSSAPIAQARSPARSTARTQTPSSSASKRQSTMHHVSGLGARTISPTDARRLKRLSMNPNLPGGPVSPPTPQADFSFDERSFNQSPAMIFRKSVTPSSARVTPDQNPNRKSYASAISVSSNSSLNSLRVGNATLQPRNPTLAASRLPTPKPRNIHSSAGAEEEEEVPPVPAIPKAYESPKDPEHQSFLFATSGLKSNVALRPSPERTTSDDMASISSRNTQTKGTDPVKMEAAQKGKATIRHRRGLTVGSGSDADKSPSVQSNKKNLQPIRLPPLNLLPLGTPFNNRISSFPAPSAELDDRNTTPPRATNKTPSTPMTASKASFFLRNNNVDQYDGTKNLRSSSSAFNLKSVDASLHNASPMPVPTLNPNRQIATPFSSNSLPKNSSEYAHLYSRPSGEYKLSDTDVEMQSIKVQGPRASQKDTSDSAQTSTSTEPETPSSGSSLRRKLSLSGWRRASSKAATHTSRTTNQARNASQKNEEKGPQPPKHGDMPPPKLPASATWSGSLGASPTRTRPSLDFGRRKPSAPTTATSDIETEKHGHKLNGNLGVRASSGYLEQPNGQSASKPSSSILTPMQRMLGSKSSTNMLKARNLDSNLDRDDLIADEEMKKLASKRKDFEHAARDVDELRKRARPQERVTANQALQMVSLNMFEKGEIIDYKEIYFCGTKGAKKHIGDLNATTANFGYDDDRGDYNIVLGDHLAYRYEVVDLLGKGSFGQVVRCIDHKTGGLVAIKIIRNKKRFHQQALVEVNILQKLREWDPENKHSMINFTQSFYFRGHLCISTELLGMNLYEFIKAYEFKGFSLRLIRRFCKQMLSSLVMLKSKRVIHCDLKPENILLAHPLHSEIKVIDFGSSCFENEKVYTYIQSRFYRSPEVILGMSYGLPIDMWSLGCILAELLTGYPIFPGENEQEQLACIMEIFGPPEKHLIEKSSRKKLFFDSMGKPRVTVSTKGRRRRPSSKTLQQALKCEDDTFLDFIARCLRWDPDRRMKPDEAMLHEFITGVKRVARPRPPINGTLNMASPAKRVPPSQTPSQRIRPLPEPPATSFKNGTAIGSHGEVSGSSPVKSGPRRLSTAVQGPSTGAGIKRSVNGAPAPATSSLPRAAQRSVSGKPDLASAAAVASLKSSR